MGFGQPFISGYGPRVVLLQPTVEVIPVDVTESPEFTVLFPDTYSAIPIVISIVQAFDLIAYNIRNFRIISIATSQLTYKVYLSAGAHGTLGVKPNILIEVWG